MGSPIEEETQAGLSEEVDGYKEKSRQLYERKQSELNNDFEKDKSRILQRKTESVELRHAHQKQKEDNSRKIEILMQEQASLDRQLEIEKQKIAGFDQELRYKTDTYERRSRRVLLSFETAQAYDREQSLALTDFHSRQSERVRPSIETCLSSRVVQPIQEEEDEVEHADPSPLAESRSQPDNFGGQEDNPIEPPDAEHGIISNTSEPRSATVLDGEARTTAWTAVNQNLRTQQKNKSPGPTARRKRTHDELDNDESFNEDTLSDGSVHNNNN